MIRALLSLALHSVLLWNARQAAGAQRHFAAKLEEDMYAAQRGIPLCDAMVHGYESKVRKLRADLRAYRLARLFKGTA